MDEHTIGDSPKLRIVRRGRGRPDPHVMGDEGGWQLNVPSMWRALADPTGRHAFPKVASPKGAESDLEALLAYWSPLPQLLQFSLGWHPEDGPHTAWGGESKRAQMGTGAVNLAFALEAGGLFSGPDVEDLRVQFIQAVWGPHLDVFAAWCLRDRELLTHLRERRKQPFSVEEQPFAENLLGDTLQLADHWGTPWAPSFGGPENAEASGACSVTEAGERAVLLLERYVGWYRTLTELGPQLGATQVDVVVKPVGWLGTFQRSPLTGIWYSGDHDLHMMGHSSTSNGQS